MCSHLFSLHPSIWEIVESGMHFDSIDNPVIINEQIHKNAQATTVLLASLCRDEYNKVSGLDKPTTGSRPWSTRFEAMEAQDGRIMMSSNSCSGHLRLLAPILSILFVKTPGTPR
jgi:hypothetical protein